MGLLAELPRVHIEIFSAIEEIEQQLEQLHRHRTAADRCRQLGDDVASRALRLRAMLGVIFERERRELYPRVSRIFGDDVAEMERLRRQRTEVVAALDRFISTITDQPLPDHLVGAVRRFDRFVQCYEQRCETERSFYRTNSTILFPGGVSTD